MVIRIVLISVFLLTGCSKKSDIWIKLCNDTTQSKNIKVLWSGADKSVYLQGGQCKSIKIDPIKGESSISLINGTDFHTTNTYFGPYGYRGIIHINIQANNKIATKENITIHR
jgi:major membrane immunogen (membrane-anchored lipoprotein)